MDSLSKKLKYKGLKVTPQRMIVYNAIIKLNNHPTAENIIDYINKAYPVVTVGAVYKILDSFVQHGIIAKVKTDKDVMRYDSVLEKHHHLYCKETDRIEDYEDAELDKIVAEHFEKKNIKGFKINNVTLQITGKFTDNH